MNVVLISIFLYESLAVRYLFSYLKANNISVHYIGFQQEERKRAKTLQNMSILYDIDNPETTDEDVEILLSQLKILNPSLIGISVNSAQFPVARRITEAIKRKFKIPIIWGGSHPTVTPERCLEYTDMVCIGEGFDALLELSQRIGEGKTYYDIRNLWIRNGNKIIRNEMRPLIDNLDLLPHPSFDGENKYYIDEGRIQKKGNLDCFNSGFTDDPGQVLHYVMTYFGCPMRCSYCIHGTNYAKDKNIKRRRSVNNVIEELMETKKKNPFLSYIMFWDNIFTVSKEWCLEFAELYQKKVRLPFFIYVYPRRQFADVEVLQALREAGLSWVNVGIQSGSDRTKRKYYYRYETKEEALEVACRLSKLNVFTAYDVIKNNPLEEDDDLKETLDLLIRMPKPLSIHCFNMSFFPNYVLTKMFLERGIIKEEDIEGVSALTSAHNWMDRFDAKKEYHGFYRKHEYFALLFSLTQFKIFPTFLIRKIEQRRLFINNLNILYYICRVVRFIEIYIVNFASTRAWIRAHIRHRRLARGLMNNTKE